MGQRHPPSTELTPAANGEPSIEDAGRRLEVEAVADRTGVAGPELPNSRLAAAVPFLIARATAETDGYRDDRERPSTRRPSKHTSSASGDLEFARLGTRLAYWSTV
ncbi:hypothetical protein RBH26_05295 [Natronolimnohabitans sp. A-GB9]|uniref:hypothetical protein n=1 Tax=Natronolimnohabitans sp. A-GB9 TaxID=3069757 RepID=UPI0027ADEB7E|nr:hypothetical protein [Natronolimnohabitans sp. A-GB9]MDQ2049893.1 hypothetical protein [Natronolimnohabitans sp. A-GB9]